MEREPSAVLLTGDEPRQLVRGWLASGEFWIFIPSGPDYVPHLASIEREFYSGEAAADFNMLATVFPGNGLLAIAAAHKRRLAPEVLAAALFRLGSHYISSEVLETRDCLLLGPHDETSLALMGWFAGWLQGRVPPMQRRQKPKAARKRRSARRSRGLP